MLGILLGIITIIVAIILLCIIDLKKASVTMPIIFIIILLFEIFFIGDFSLNGGMNNIVEGALSLKASAVGIIAIAAILIIGLFIFIGLYRGKKVINTSIDTRNEKKAKQEEEDRVYLEALRKIYLKKELNLEEINNEFDLEEDKLKKIIEKLLKEDAIMKKEYNEKSFLVINRWNKKSSLLKKAINERFIDSSYFESTMNENYILELLKREKNISCNRIKSSYVDIEEKEALKCLKGLIEAKKIMMDIKLDSKDIYSNQFKSFEPIMQEKI